MPGFGEHVPGATRVGFELASKLGPCTDGITGLLSYSTPDRGEQTALSDEPAFVRVASCAHSEPGHLVDHWRHTSAAAVRAAGATNRRGRFETQGHVLEVADFVNTLVVEATIHYLDLILNLPAAPPARGALRIVREVLDGLLGQPPAAGWSDTEYALKGTGRLALSADDEKSLGGQAGKLPLLG